MTVIDSKKLSAIEYFVKHTHNCRKTKLFKLLYFLDFVHFKKHGISVTGYDYIAMPLGPVPVELYNQITAEELPEDFKGALSITEEKDDDGVSRGFKIQLKKSAQIDLDWFSPNERNILEQVADIFKYATAKEMSEITHLKNSPWDTTKKLPMV